MDCACQMDLHPACNIKLSVQSQPAQGMTLMDAVSGHRIRRGFLKHPAGFSHRKVEAIQCRRGTILSNHGFRLQARTAYHAWTVKYVSAFAIFI